MKKSFDIWESKLCEEYKMHVGLIKNNAKTILESMINYGKLNNEREKKINYEFTKGIFYRKII